MPRRKYLSMLNLKWLRKAAGLTQATLAEKVGVHRNQITDYETGKQRPCETTLKRLARVLKVNIEDLT